MKMSLVLKTLIAVGSISIGSAQGATLSYNFLLPRVDGYTGVFDTGNGIVFPNFDANLGTLTGVNLETRVFLSESATVQGSTRVAPIQGTFTTRLGVDVFGTSGSTGYIPAPNHTITVPLTPIDNIFGISRGVVSYSFDESFVLNPTLFVPDAFFPLNSLYYYAYASPVGLSPASDGAIGVSASGSAIVTYTFAPIPEPNSLFLMGVGLFGVWARRKRRFRA